MKLTHCSKPAIIMSEKIKSSQAIHRVCITLKSVTSISHISSCTANKHKTAIKPGEKMCAKAEDFSSLAALSITLLYLLEAKQLHSRISKGPQQCLLLAATLCMDWSSSASPS